MKKVLAVLMILSLGASACVRTLVSPTADAGNGDSTSGDGGSTDGPRQSDLAPRDGSGYWSDSFLFDQGDNNEVCAAAAPLAFAAGSVSISESTANAQDDLLLSTLDCTGYSTAGPDLFYRVELREGYRYRLELVTPSFNGALYLFGDCADPAGTCGVGMGADRLSAGSYPEQILIAPQATATYYIGVDGRTAADKGAFTLTVTEEIRPANDFCESATALVLVGGYLATTGDTRQAMNDLELQDLPCLEDPWSGEPLDTPGADLFYSVNLVSGNTYLFTATPLAWDYTPAIYLFTSCAQPKQTCVAGHTWDMHDSPASFTYTPSTSGTYILAVDSSYASAGAFTLEVKTPP